MKSTNNQELHEEEEEPLSSKDVGASWKWNSTKTKALTISLFLLLLILAFYRIQTGPLSIRFWFKTSHEELLTQDASSDVKIDDKLLGGLLLPGLEESSCQSRYRLNLHLRRPRPTDLPSSYLISRLRKYEALQKQCGPDTEPYKKAVEGIKSGKEVTDSSDCKYVIHSPINGLGNRMLTLGATFLYALLTDRVLFIGDGGNMPDLFCEPFPEVSWKLPPDFPIGRLGTYRPYYAHNNSPRNDTLLKYFYLGYGFDNNKQSFYCDHAQVLLQKVPWINIKSDQYFLPSLFLIPTFQTELDNLFPKKETVFHHLGRYIFHPSNSVWGLITRYYNSYLAKADEIIGIQIRVISNTDKKTPLLDQVMDCAVNENWLPAINITEPTMEPTNNPKTKAVLVTSLTADHSEYLKNRYWQYATVTGEEIAVHQPSHDEYQRSQDEMHDTKALAEIYLLSLSDKLIISGHSTFGYTAHSLGGLRPLILRMPSGQVVPNPPCQQSLSMEPCYNLTPAYYACRNTSRIESANHVPYVRHCEDIPAGLKLID